MGPQAPSLRPRKNPEKEGSDEKLGNRIVDLSCIIALINEALRDHQKFPAHCETIDLLLHSERKVYLGSDLKFACQNREKTEPA